MINKILIIDDSITARFTVRKCIPSDEGYEIFEAKNGTDGLKLFKDISPLITFLDLTMPDISGFEVLQEIKKINSKAYVVMITADIQKRTRNQAMELGAIDVMKKPPLPEHVHAHLKSMGEHTL
jgi:two-component system chemotaxis response regulator CheY